MQTPSAVLNIGADVAKKAIAVACSEGSFPVREVANQRTTVLAFLNGLPAGSRIGVESTGTYHELFAELAHQLGFLVFVLNPKDTRHYAKAVGLRGKTDRVDAELIARMIAHEHTKLHAWIPPTAQQREIDRLIKRRATLISLREAVAMSLQELGGFAADLKALRTRFNQLIARIDLRVKVLVEASPERKQNLTRLCTITGVGRSSAPPWSTPSSGCRRRAQMLLSPSPAWTHDRMTRDSIAANGACPNAARLNCAGCSTWPRCRQ
jgi:transposase